MSEDREQDITFNEDQQQMFGIAEENRAPDATRARTPGTTSPPDPDANFQPPAGAGEAQAGGQQPSPLPHIAATRSPGGTDIASATSTREGAGGDMVNPGGTTPAE